MEVCMLNFEVQVVNKRFIDIHMRLSPVDPMWHATFVYGELRIENRHPMWCALCELKAASTLPWFVLVDFNEMLWQHEHLSVCLRGERAK